MSEIKQYFETILAGNDLSFDQAKDFADSIFEGKVREVQIAAFLAAMRVKDISSDELAGLATSMRGHAVKVETDLNDLVDTCGTGSAKLKTFNISTTAAFVAAGAGVHVAKHGNRGITSKCGSADVLTELGVKVDASPQIIAQCIEEANIGFMFAPMFHPAMKYVQPIRKALGFRTAFNILGPLVNPAGAKRQVIGVPEESAMEKIAQTLKRLGAIRAMVVHSEGLDEISTMSKTKIFEIKDGQIIPNEISPEDFGFETADFEQLKGADAPANAKITRDILTGKETDSKKQIVVLNAAAAIIVAGIADDFNDAIKQTDKAIENGNALACLEKMIEISNS